MKRLISACKIALLIAGPSLIVAPFYMVGAPGSFLLGFCSFILFWYIMLGRSPEILKERPFRIALIIRYTGCLIIDLVGAFVILPTLLLPYTLRHSGAGYNALSMTEHGMVLPALLMQGIWLHLCVFMLYGIIKMIRRQQTPSPDNRL